MVLASGFEKDIRTQVTQTAGLESWIPSKVFLRRQDSIFLNEIVD